MNRGDIMLISSGYDQQIKFWSDIQDTKCKHSFEYKESAINSLEITQNKNVVAFSSQNSIKFLDMQNPNTIALSIDSHEGIISSLLFPPDFVGQFISCGEDNTVRINDSRVGKAVKTYYHLNYVNSVVSHNDNKDLIAVDENGSVKIWDMVKDQPRNIYDSPTEEEGSAFRSCAIASSEGFLVCAKSSGLCCIFDLKTDKELTLTSSFEAHKNYITKCILNPDKNLLATCSADSEVRIWERNVGDEKINFNLKSRLVGHKKWVWDCDFSLDSKYLISCSSDKSIKIWSVESSKVLTSLPNNKGVNNIALVDEDIDQN